LFSKGYDAMKKEEYLMVEKYFLESLFEYSKNNEDYVSLLGSLDQLSLYLYPQGDFENKDSVRFPINLYCKSILGIRIWERIKIQTIIYMEFNRELGR